MKKAKFSLPGNWVQQAILAMILAQLLLAGEIGPRPAKRGRKGK